MSSPAFHDRQIALLVALLAVILLLAAAGLLLARDPGGPVPGLSQALTPTFTHTSTQLPATETPQPSPTPTRLPRSPFPRFTASATANLPNLTVTPPTATVTPITGTTIVPPSPSSTTSAAAPLQTPTESLPSPTPTVTQGPAPVIFNGRVVLNGQPASGVVIELAAENAITATTGADGTFQFGLDTINGEFSLNFSQEANLPKFSGDDIATWAWFEGTAVSRGVTLPVDLPDLEIGLDIGNQHFEPLSPLNGSSYTASTINPDNPLVFAWEAYTGAESYWVDLKREGTSILIWQSTSTSLTSASFDGIVSGGNKIPPSPGDYWWNIGAKKQMGLYTMYVYSHMWDLTFTP